MREEIINTELAISNRTFASFVCSNVAAYILLANWMCCGHTISHSHKQSYYTYKYFMFKCYMVHKLYKTITCMQKYLTYYLCTVTLMLSYNCLLIIRHSTFKYFTVLYYY